MRNNKNTVKPPRNGSILPSRRNVKYSNSKFTRIVDPIVDSCFVSPPVLSIGASTAGGILRGSLLLSPFGTTAYNLTTSTKVQVHSPRLPWLYSTARNFAQFRVTNASLIVAGTLGSTVPGTVVVHSSADVDDAIPYTSTGAVGGTMFDLASLANKHKVIPLRIDSTWKKATDITSDVVGGAFVTFNSINDISFCNIGIAVSGAPVSSNLFTYYVEYDVEFKTPIAVGMNA